MKKILKPKFLVPVAVALVAFYAGAKLSLKMPGTFFNPLA